ncbi:hypothetical protein AKJ09_06508 [Labilithrix luteola]|uniref:Type IV fimbrial biogenesis protein PilY1 n=1 Tax=Labilithrix luteola TaxID=1391654 RepID=A0A0K1Q3A0_9BACT|nr:hypothetical protein [Labilithrix luteola]AKU99844.1 hypothetical protein AKJ09_06508 [Labilithrix luteola]
MTGPRVTLPILLLFAGVGAVAAGAACASNESASASENDAGGLAPGDVPDGAADGGSTQPGLILDGATDSGCGAECEWFTAPCSPTSMCVVQTGIDPLSTLSGVTCDEAAVWAVGAQGLIVHHDGQRWSHTQLSPPNPQSTVVDSLTSVILRPGGELWTLGTVITMYVGPGAADAGPSGFAPLSMTYWGVYNSTTTGLWAHPESNSAWVISEYLYRVDKASDGMNATPYFALQPGAPYNGPRYQISAVHGATKDAVWAVGRAGVSYRIQDVDADVPLIDEFNTQTYDILNGVWEVAPNDVWAVGGNGTIRHYTGKGLLWDIVPSPTGKTITAMWGSSASNLWAVGEGGLVLHYDGAAWKRVPVSGLGDRIVDFVSVWGVGDGRVFAVGGGTLIALGTTLGNVGGAQ